MFGVGKNNNSRESNLIRLHPKTGGVHINFGGQYFQGVSTDLFLGLDLKDLRRTYQNTRKFNLSISVNPSCWTIEQFLSYLTSGDLERTQKCALHGDKDTGLYASNHLMKLLSFEQFNVDGVHYAYDSIGVACNPSYASASQRTGNAFENSSSHFEIKFRRQSVQNGPDEYLCLNIHLMREQRRSFGQSETLERLKQAIQLFYAELGLSTRPHTSCTNLRQALTVTLSNYEAKGFSCKHEQSLDALENNAVAVKYTPDASRTQGLSLWDCAKKSQKSQKNKKHASLNVKPSDAAMVTTSVLPPAAEEKPAPNAWSTKLTF